MQIECPQCGARGKIDPSRLPEQGAHLKCKHCSERFFVAKPTEGTVPPPPRQPDRAAQPSPPPPVTPVTPSPQASPPPLARCQMCDNIFDQQEMVRFGDRWICAGCKPVYVQRLQQGESTALEMQYAGFWVRVAAKIIDSILLMIILMPFSIAFSAMMRFDPNNPAAISSSMGAIMGLQYLVQIIIPALLTMFFLGKYQATPGKMALGLIVVTPERGKISYMRALGRHFAEWISGMILGIGYLMVGFDTEKRSLHDRICSTRVVRK